MFNKNLEYNFKYKNILKNYEIDEDYIETVMNKMYDSSSKEYNNRKILFKKCAELCKADDKFSIMFKPIKDKVTDEIRYRTDFFIVESTRINENNKEKELYSFMINSPKQREVAHAGTFKKVIDENKNLNYEICDEYNYRSIDFKSIVEKSNKYNKKINNLNNRYITPQEDKKSKNEYGIVSDGIGIIAEADIKIAKTYKRYIGMSRNYKEEYSYISYYGSEDYKKNDNEVNGLIIGSETASDEDIEKEYHRYKRIYDSIGSKDFDKLYEEIDKKYQQYNTKLNEYKKSFKNYNRKCRENSSEECMKLKNNLNVQKTIVEKYGKARIEFNYLSEIKSNYEIYEKQKNSYEYYIKQYNEIRDKNKDIEKYESFEKDYNYIKDYFNNEIEKDYNRIKEIYGENNKNKIDYVINVIKQEYKNIKEEIFNDIIKDKNISYLEMIF